MPVDRPGQKPKATLTNAVVVEIRTDRPDDSLKLVPDDGTILEFLAWQRKEDVYPLGVGGATAPGVCIQTFDAEHEPAIREWLDAKGVLDE